MAPGAHAPAAVSGCGCPGRRLWPPAPWPILGAAAAAGGRIETCRSPAGPWRQPTLQPPACSARRAQCPASVGWATGNRARGRRGGPHPVSWAGAAHACAQRRHECVRRGGLRAGRLGSWSSVQCAVSTATAGHALPTRASSSTRTLFICYSQPATRLRAPPAPPPNPPRLACSLARSPASASG